MLLCLHNVATEPHIATSVFAIRLPQTDTTTAIFCGITATAQHLKKCGISGVLLTLSTKYEILDLATMTSEALEKLPLTKGTLIFAATVANNYKSAFDDLSSKLMMRCLKFFLDTTTGGGDVLALMKATEENFPEASLDILREARNVTNATLQIPGISAEPVLFLCTSIMYSLLI